MRNPFKTNYLWPEKFGEQFYKAQLEQLGPHLFAALYGCNPTNKASTLVDPSEWSYYDRVPPLGQIAAVAVVFDPASDEKETSDYTAGGTFVLGLDGRMYLTEMFRERVECPDLFKAIAQARQDAAQKYQRPPVNVHIVIEKSSNGVAVLQEFKRQNFESGQIRWAFTGYETRGKSKYVRASQVSGWPKKGRLLLPKGREWTKILTNEWFCFPYGKHDDTVDMCAMAVSYARGIISGRKFFGMAIGDDDPFDNGPEGTVFDRSDRLHKKYLALKAKDPNSEETQAAFDAWIAAGQELAKPSQSEVAEEQRTNQMVTALLNGNDLDEQGDWSLLNDFDDGLNKFGGGF
jgi:predicted phage terminase large subunit-like protein